MDEWIGTDHTLTAVRGILPNAVQVQWDDGSEAVVDLQPVLSHEDFAFLRDDPETFRRVGMGAKRRTLVWIKPDDGALVSLHVDAVWRLLHDVPPPLEGMPA